MSYNITVTNHPLIVISDGTLDNSTSLTLVGKNYPSYGQYIAQNLVNMLQNFAGSTQPASVITGQIWYDTGSNSLKIYTGTSFKNVSGVTASNSQPTSALQGDLWYDTNNQQLSIYTGTSWLLIGPSYTVSQQKTAALAANIVDISDNSHVVLQLWVGGVLTGIISKDAEFTPKVGITGFSSIKPGYNINASIFLASGILITGTLTQNAQPYITSLGTLTSLTVSTPIIGSVLGTATSVTAAAQPNITSVGASLIVNGPLTTLGSIGGTIVNAGVIGNSGATFTGASSTLAGLSQAAAFTTSGGGQLTGYHTGAIGANTPNSGTFTTVTTSSTISASGIVSAPTIRAGTIGNSGAVFTGASISTTGAMSASGTISAPTINAGVIGNSGTNFSGLTQTLNGASVANSYTTSYNGQFVGYHTGAIGTFAPNSGAFTTVTATTATVSGTLNVPALTTLGPIQSQNILAAPSIYGQTIGNTGANFTGASSTMSGTTQATTVIATNTIYGLGAIRSAGPILSNSKTTGIGYTTGAGGTVTQTTSRTTTMTLNATCGAFTLYSASQSSGTTFTFKLNNNTVDASDLFIITQQSGAGIYVPVTNVNNGNVDITMYCPKSISTEAPKFNFAVIKSVLS